MARRNGGDGGGSGEAVARIVFELEEAKCRLVHMNTRLEKHGEEDRLACDLNFEWDTDNGCLAMFSPTLRSALYQRPTGPQTELPGTSTPEHLTEVKYPELMPVKWRGGKVVGAELRFHVGTSDKSHVVFGETTVDKYSLECKEGGTVCVRWQAQVYPTDAQAGKLSKLLVDKHCEVSVTPPDPGGVEE